RQDELFEKPPGDALGRPQGFQQGQTFGQWGLADEVVVTLNWARREHVERIKIIDRGRQSRRRVPPFAHGAQNFDDTERHIGKTDGCENNLDAFGRPNGSKDGEFMDYEQTESGGAYGEGDQHSAAPPRSDL